MTIKEKLEEKISELEALKDELTKISDFYDPNNQQPVYSEQDIKSISATTGVTPYNFGEAISIVIKKINEYYDYINSIDHIEVSSVMRDRILNNYLIGPYGVNYAIPEEYMLAYEKVPFSSTMDMLPDADYISPISKINITATPTIRYGSSSGVDIPFGIIFSHINPRLAIQNKTTFPNGVLSVSMNREVMHGDDLFFVGVYFKEAPPQDSAIYMDLTYRIDLIHLDGSTDKKLFTIGNSKIGVCENPFDISNNDIVVAWDIVSINRFDFRVGNTRGDTTQISTSADGGIGSGFVEGNIVDRIFIQQFDMDLGALALSYRDSVAWYRGVYDCDFQVHTLPEEGATTVSFLNLKPINEVIYEALREL